MTYTLCKIINVMGILYANSYLTMKTPPPYPKPQSEFGAHPKPRSEFSASPKPRSEFGHPPPKKTPLPTSYQCTLPYKHAIAKW